MASRTRKLVGILIMLVFLTFYALLALAVAVALEVNTTSKWVELAFYAVAGLIWIVPAGVIIKWMSGGHDVDPDKAS
ncbi:MAG: DUF2842 domain-containing protein [Pseudomonadota bacterium]